MDFGPVNLECLHKIVQGFLFNKNVNFMSVSFNVLIRMCIWHTALRIWKINILLPFVCLSGFLLIFLVPQTPYKISLILFKLVNLQTPKVQFAVTFKVWIITSKIHIWTNISAGIHYKILEMMWKEAVVA